MVKGGEAILEAGKGDLLFLWSDDDDDNVCGTKS
jgi:hypothetical protein